LKTKTSNQKYTFFIPELPIASTANLIHPPYSIEIIA